jgi:transcriptional regulator with XRE-family HTH domain
MKFKEYLTQKQSKLNLSQNHFAIYLGVDKTTLSFILNNERKPTPKFIYRVCTKFNDDKLIPSFLEERLS